MSGDTYIFFSDIHIGMNTSVNWYQQSVHEPYVLAALSYVQGLGKDVEDLVILGDMVDQWTVLPSDQPPSVYDIYQANPNVFLGSEGSPGALVECLSSINGRVCYVNGNHDMFVTAQDVNAIRDKEGNFMHYFLSGAYSIPGTQGGVYALHGNQFSMLCAPDPWNDPPSTGHHGGLPLGHYVTRLSAQWAYNELKNTEKYPPGSTVANMPNTGYPTGWYVDMEGLEEILLTIITDILEGKSVELSQIILNALNDIAGFGSGNTSFSMFPNYGTNGSIDLNTAISTYGSLFTQWDDRYGFWHALSALKDADIEDKLAPFAANINQMPGLNNQVVIMGHTHKPLEDPSNSSQDYIYANSGFNCPSIPDMQNSGKCPTFVQVTVNSTEYVVSVMKVGPAPDYSVTMVSQDSINISSGETVLQGKCSCC